MATNPPQAETLGYWLRRFTELRRRQAEEHRALEQEWRAAGGYISENMKPYAQHPTEHLLREG